MARRIFLSWSRPLLPAAVDHLCADWQEGALDLSHIVAVVPTAEAGRRLRASLALRAADRGTAVLSPHVITPEVITTWAQQEMPSAATPAEALLTWMQVLRELPLEEFAALFPVPPVSRDMAWARGAAAGFLRLTHLLEEGGRDIAEAARQLGAGHPEAERWSDLARLESRVHRAMKRHGLKDPVSARISAAGHPVFPPGVTRIVMVAVPDPVTLVITALENAMRQGTQLDVLIHAPESESSAFDAWGRPLPEVWSQRIIDIPESADRIRLLARPEDAAEALVKVLLEHEAEPECVAAGSADPAVAAPLKDAALKAGLAVFDPNGIPLGSHELTWMFTSLAGLLRNDDAREAARLLRLPAVLRAARPGLSSEYLLREWDEFQQAHLPRTLTDALALLGTWTPRRRGFPDDWKFALRPVLQWVHDQCRAMRRGNGIAALHSFIDSICAVNSLDAAADQSLFSDALELWLETLDAINRATERTGFEMDAAGALDMALHLLRDSRLYPDNTEADRVLHGWLELPWQEAPHLAVAGLNEGMAPDNITGDPWLPNSVRSALGLKTNAVRLARDSYLLTSMIECRRGGGSVLLLAARESSAGDPLKPSRLLLRCPDDELAARALRLFPKEEMEDERPSPPAWHRAWKLRVPAPDRDSEVFSKMSVTQFVDYLSCPFRFYLKHVLRMEPFDAARDEMNARDFGSLIHDSIQRLHENETLCDSSDEPALADFLDDTIRGLTAARYGDEPALPVIIQLESARSRLRTLARIQAAERAAGWRVEHVEKSFPEKLENIVISGRIDLIERNIGDGRCRVIDYKTGAKGTDPEKAHVKAFRGSAGAGIPDWQQFEYGGKPCAWINLQLPFYFWIVSRLGYENIEAGYVNLPVATSEAGVKIWTELDCELMKSGIECASGVIRSIHEGRFWPPAKSLEYDDFESLWFHGITDSFDHALLEKFRELQVGMNG